jgi:hypothetical protein
MWVYPNPPHDRKAGPVPTRRILEIIIVVNLAMIPVVGLGRLWSAKALRETSPGSVSHGVGEIGSVIF